MRALFTLVLLSILPSVAFAAVFNQDDIGSLIFRDFLKMTDYPGAPFSGNIVNDLVMFLFIPTVFIIVVVYTLAGRLTDTPKINLLISIAFYAFIVFGGYYRIFALLAGPYFLFMLIFLGLFMFLIGHFGLRRAGGGMTTRAAGGGGMSGSAVGLAQGETDLTLQLLRGAMTFQGQMQILDNKIRDLQKEYSEAKSEHNDRLANSLQMQKHHLEGLRDNLKQQKRFDPTPGPVQI